jgi:hypothetical protein
MVVSYVPVHISILFDVKSVTKIYTSEGCPVLDTYVLYRGRMGKHSQASRGLSHV